MLLRKGCSACRQEVKVQRSRVQRSRFAALTLQKVSLTRQRGFTIQLYPAYRRQAFSFAPIKQLRNEKNHTSYIINHPSFIARAFQLSPFSTLLTITTPFPLQVYHRYNYQLTCLGCKNNTHFLSVMRYAFQRVRNALAASFNFLFIQHPILPNLLHFCFIYLPAIHPAKCMLAIYKFAERPV